MVRVRVRIGVVSQWLIGAIPKWYSIFFGLCLVVLYCSGTLNFIRVDSRVGEYFLRFFSMPYLIEYEITGIHIFWGITKK